MSWETQWKAKEESAAKRDTSYKYESMPFTKKIPTNASNTSFTDVMGRQ